MNFEAMKADVLEAIIPDRWRTPKLIANAVNAMWRRRGEKTFFLGRPLTIARSKLRRILEELEYDFEIEFRFKVSDEDKDGEKKDQQEEKDRAQFDDWWWKDTEYQRCDPAIAKIMRAEDQKPRRSAGLS